MPAAHRKGDIGSGHACHFPPTPAIGGSENVYINMQAAMRAGDAYAPHACAMQCVPGAHPRHLIKGSATVFINGLPAARVGDAIDCGGTASTGSTDVLFD